jgi:hypothetical protein
MALNCKAAMAHQALAPHRSAYSPPLMITSKTPCPVCGSRQAVTLATRDGKTRQPLHTIQCRNRGLGRTDPMPTPAELELYYTTDYRQDYKAQHQPHLRHVGSDADLRVLARPFSQPAAAHRTGLSVRPATIDALLAAQRSRRWLPYAMSQARGLVPISKAVGRWQERVTAKRLADPQRVILFAGRQYGLPLID